MAWPPVTHQDVKDAINTIWVDATTSGRGLVELATVTETTTGTDTARGITAAGVRAALDARVSSINVKDYGAVGDGTTDDTTAIQAAINAASGGAAGAEPSPSRTATARVYLPPGTYKTTTAPLLKSIIGMTVFGAGARLSRIKVSGTRTDGITVIGCPDLILEDFGVVGDGVGGTAQVTNGVAVDWTPTQTATWGSHQLVSRVYVEELKFAVGMAFGTRSGVYDLSGVHASDCYVAGNRALTSDDTDGLWQAGYKSGNGTSGNVLNHHFTKCEGAFVRRLFHVNAVNMVSIDGGNGSFLDAALYRQGEGITRYSNARIEDSQRLAESSGGAGYPWNLLMDNIHWAPADNAATDRMIIKWPGTGTVVLRQLELEQAASAVADWLFQFNTQGVTAWQTTVLIDGIVTTNATAQSLFSIPTGTKCFAEVKGLVQCNYAAGVTGTFVNRKVLVYNGASGDAGTSAITT